MSKTKSAYQLMKEWPGMSPSEAVRVGSDGWVECAITGCGIKLFASKGAARKYVESTLSRFLKERDKP